MTVREKTKKARATAANRTKSVAVAGLGSTLLLILASCSVVPDWSPRQVEDLLLTVDYGPGPRRVVIPTSNRDIVIRDLFTQPSPPQEAFEDGVRKLQIPAEGLRLECRLRFYRRADNDGVIRPLPDPATLFPGARSVSTWGSPGARSAPKPPHASTGDHSSPPDAGH